MFYCVVYLMCLLVWAFAVSFDVDIFQVVVLLFIVACGLNISA